MIAHIRCYSAEYTNYASRILSPILSPIGWHTWREMMTKSAEGPEQEVFWMLRTPNHFDPKDGWCTKTQYKESYFSERSIGHVVFVLPVLKGGRFM